jgi:hypothetical protein
MVAANVIKGDTVICHASDVLQREPGSYCFLDIRSPAELKQFGEYPDALSILWIPCGRILKNYLKIKRFLSGVRVACAGMWHTVFCRLTASGHII